MLGKSLKLGAVGVGSGLACWSATSYNKKSSLGARSSGVLAFGGASSATGVSQLPLRPLAFALRFANRN